MSRKKTKKQLDSQVEKNTLYELSSGLSVLFLPVLFCIGFLTGYDPSLAFPLLPHAVFMFIFIFSGLMVTLIQKSFIKQSKPKKILDRLSYLSFAFLFLTVLALFSTQI